MQDLVSSGRIADLVLLVMLVEAAVLVMARPARLGAVDVVALLLPGACLVLALRGALTGAGWTWIALSLSAAFLAHVADLLRRVSKKGA